MDKHSSLSSCAELSFQAGGIRREQRISYPSTVLNPRSTSSILIHACVVLCHRSVTYGGDQSIVSDQSITSACIDPFIHALISYPSVHSPTHSPSIHASTIQSIHPPIRAKQYGLKRSISDFDFDDSLLVGMIIFTEKKMCWGLHQGFIYDGVHSIIIHLHLHMRFEYCTWPYHDFSNICINCSIHTSNQHPRRQEFGELPEHYHSKSPYL